QGSAKQLDDNRYELVASIVLIIDGSETTIVDTGLATDLTGRNNMLKKLADLNINPLLVNYVITTDGQPDHSGNTNSFPESLHFAGIFMYYKTQFSLSKLFHEDIINVSPNVHLLKTPGHSPDGITVIVTNAKNYGTVAVTGDVFTHKEDLKYSNIWQILSKNITEQAESRRTIICLVDYIIPGHGEIFLVESRLKQKLNCPIDYKLR
ncbi:unnamed protein product, partial [Dracunculus medinensis]|uniref:Metallo-beta-lactamase domain-containing protein 1 n=1 Tax=Dracunculus medinensis TaxID=318479 RepID=A0A0N4UKI4_DRAME